MKVPFLLPDELDPIVIVISRDEVEAGDIQPSLSALQSCIASVDMIRDRFERFDVAFHGYYDDSREVFEIPEVRDFVHRLDGEFPFWLFFLSKGYMGLQAVTLCFLPPHLTEEAKKTILPQRLDQLLNNRWWPAMNHICEAVGFSETEIEELSERVVGYFTRGPIRD